MSNLQNQSQIQLKKQKLSSGILVLSQVLEQPLDPGGHPLAMKFEVDLSESGGATLLPTLLVGYPIVVQNTTVVGTGITSVDSSDSEIVGISTTVDNVYYVSDFSITGNVGVITSNIKSDIITTGISSNGDYVGEFSWGKLRTSRELRVHYHLNQTEIRLTLVQALTQLLPEEVLD